VPVGLARVKAKAIFGVGSGSRLGWVRVGSDGLRRNPYPGAVRSAGLG
jgi:hypothetical protein